MRSIKINFKAEGSDILWNTEITDESSLVQKSSVALMTRLGSDTSIPGRGTKVLQTLLGSGVFDLMRIQHILNFGALKARADIRNFESSQDDLDRDRVKSINTTLIDLQNNIADVGVVVTNLENVSSNEIINIV